MSRTTASPRLRLPSWPIAALALLWAGPLHGALIQGSGVLQTDDEIASVTFAVLAQSNVSITTSSYGAGGFFPVLSLFLADAPGDLILAAAGNLGVCDTGMTPPPGQSNCEDIRWSGILAPGTYLATLTVYPNLPLGPDRAAGFLFDGAGNFTSLFGGSGPFLEPDGTPKSGNWDLTISGDDVAPVPEPAAGALAAAGLAFTFLLRATRRRI